jgi:hypothetical protein
MNKTGEQDLEMALIGWHTQLYARDWRDKREQRDSKFKAWSSENLESLPFALVSRLSLVAR